MRRQVAVVDWIDHADLGNDQAWTKIADIDARAPICRSVGFVVRETDDGLVISHTVGDDDCSSPFLILKSAILYQERISLPASPASKRRKKRGSP
jgi:hypothetical protein